MYRGAHYVFSFFLSGWLASVHTATNKSTNTHTHSYASSTWSKKHLYPYVKPEHLASEYRTLLTLRELTSYGPPDLVCLQEASTRGFMYTYTYKRDGCVGISN